MKHMQADHYDQAPVNIRDQNMNMPEPTRTGMNPVAKGDSTTLSRARPHGSPTQGHGTPNESGLH